MPTDPLDTPEDAVRLLHKIFARKAQNDILTNSNLDFDTEKRTQLQTLCGTLTANIGKIKESDFPPTAKVDPSTDDDPGPDETIDAIQCYINYRKCRKSPQACENDYWTCISLC